MPETLKLGARLQGYHRRLVKETGRVLLRAAGRFIARQSTIGDRPVFARETFPWIADIEKDWRLVRAELDSVLGEPGKLPAFHQISPDQARISRGDSWKTLVFYVFGDRIDSNCRRCPQTARLLERVPELRNAWFSVLAPHYHIPPHRGPTNGIIRIHLGLRIPRDAERCRLRVADEILTWEEGRCIVFDDHYEHEVWNDTGETRAVLFFDVDRPLRPLGRIVNRLLIAAMKRSAYVRDAHRNLARWEQRGGRDDGRHRDAA